jgi:uncharacterized membrane protein
VSFILTPLDWAALAVFILCWAGYALVADRLPSVQQRSVLVAMDEHRRRWLIASVPRDNRIADVAIIGNLMQSTSFLANTCIFIVGGLMALLASPDLGRRVLNAVPLAEASLSDGAWEARILLLLLIWALRQFNYGSILLGGMGQDDKAVPQALVAARVVNRAARHFNTGLRAYYFGLAALAWILHPVALMAASLLVMRELYRREFRSEVREALAEP